MEEEKIADSLVLISSNRFNQVCYMHSYNSCQLNSQDIIDMINVGKAWVEVFNMKLKELTKEKILKVKIKNQAKSFLEYEKLINKENIDREDSSEEHDESEFEERGDISKKLIQKALKTNPNQANSESVNMFMIKS